MAKEIKEFRNPILAPKMVSIPKRERLFQAMVIKQACCLVLAFSKVGELSIKKLP